MRDFYTRLDYLLAGLVAAGAEGEVEELLAELRRRLANRRRVITRGRELDQMDAHGEGATVSRAEQALRRE